MKEQLKELRKYFLNKILKGDYELGKIDAHCLKLKVDKEFLFCFWVANNDYGIKQYNGFDEDINTLSLGKLTVKQKQKLWGNFKNPYMDNKKNVILKEKKEQFEKLKKELNIQ